jgi:hypothetical protein
LERGGDLCAFQWENLFFCCKLTLLFSPEYSEWWKKGRLRDWLGSKIQPLFLGGFSASKQATEADKYQTEKCRKKDQRKRKPEKSPSRN